MPLLHNHLMDSCSYVCKNTLPAPSKFTTECVWVYAQSGSEKCVVRLLDFCLSKLPSNQPAIHVRPLTKVPVDSEKPWYCRSQVEVKYPTWTFKSGRISSFNWVFAKVVPEMLTQGTRVWMLFVHMSKPQVCEKKQLVSVYIWESSMKKHMIVSKRRSLLLQNAGLPEGFYSATIFWTPKLYIQLDSSC